ncbi:MAG: PaaI family thioesterase [Lachnospiraceae bacterium]|nr:PaaI family thioesterase [Lachnospiraceae bacterium]
MLKNYYDENDVFNVENGMHMVSGEPGKAVFEVELTDKHLSHVGRTHVHPGVLYSLAESASGAAALAYGYNCFAVEGRFEYLGTATEGIVRAEAKCKDEHESETGQVKVRVFDAEGNLIARGYFVIIYTGEPFEA